MNLKNLRIKKTMDKNVLYLQIISYLLAGETKRGISKKLKVSEKTIYSHTNSTEFKELFQKIMNESFYELKGMIFNAQKKAIKYLSDILEGNFNAEDKSTYYQLRASEIIIKSNTINIVGE